VNGKYPRTSLGILNGEPQSWFEAERCWNCELEDLRNMGAAGNQPVRKAIAERFRKK